MGLFSKLRGNHPEQAAPVAVDEPVCVHAMLAPRWDNAADLGIEAKISGYRCDGCGSVFTADEGHALRTTEAARVQETLVSH